MLQILKAIMFSIEAIVAILLIGIILIQKTKGGGGLGVAFGGGGNDSLFGSRAGNVLTKGTVILAVIFMLNTVALAIIYARSHDQTYIDPALLAPDSPPATQSQPQGLTEPSAQPGPVPVQTPSADPDTSVGMPSEPSAPTLDMEPVVVPPVEEVETPVENP
jgi:preprotein translocase subunit SecG